MLSVTGDEIELASFGLSRGETAISVTVDNISLPFEQKGSAVFFSNMKVHSMLTIETRKA